MSASYAGDASFGTLSARLGRQVRRTATTSQLVVTPILPLGNTPITFRVTVRASAGGGIPAGTVRLTFNRTGTALTLNLVNGVATVTRVLPPGLEFVSARYNGTAGYSPSDALGLLLRL